MKIDYKILAKAESDWNIEADEFNQWETLDFEERLERYLKTAKASDHIVEVNKMVSSDDQPVGLSLECECDEISDGETCLKCGPSPDHSYSAKKTLTADEKENVWHDNNGDIWEPIRARATTRELGGRIFEVLSEESISEQEVMLALDLHNSTRLNGTAKQAVRRVIKYALECRRLQLQLTKTNEIEDAGRK